MEYRNKKSEVFLIILKKTDIVSTYIFMLIDKIALILVIIGGINWGAVGIFKFDVVSAVFGGQAATVSRIIYTLVCLAALWCISLLFRDRVDNGA